MGSIFPIFPGCLEFPLASADHLPGPSAAIISNPPIMPTFFRNCVCMPAAAIPWAAQKLCSSTLTTPKYKNMTNAAARACHPTRRQSTPAASISKATPSIAGISCAGKLCDCMYEAWPLHPRILPSAPWTKMALMNIRAPSGNTASVRTGPNKGLLDMRFRRTVSSFGSEYKLWSRESHGAAELKAGDRRSAFG